MDSHRVIDRIDPFVAAVIRHDDVHSDALTEIVHDEVSVDFLQNGAVFLRVEVHQPQIIFQFPEARFDAPAEIVQLFDDRGGNLSAGRDVTMVS